MPSCSTPENPKTDALKILLIANYENDRQESMLRFAYGLESELEKIGVAVEVIRPRLFFGRLWRGVAGIGKWLGYMDKFIVFPFELKHRLLRLGGDSVVHICDHSNAFYTRYLKKIPHLVTCHDLLAVRAARGEFSRARTGPTGKLLQHWILNGLRRARRIVCVSQATRRDLLRLLDGKSGIATCMGLHQSYSPMPVAQALERVRPLIGGKGGYILHVGGNQWYKNRPGVLSIYQALCEITPQVKLVMVGPPFDSAMNAFLKKHRAVASNVASLQDVDNEDLRALYSAAELLLFPSYEEGFGWPIVEAQACGCRVLTTGKAPMNEAGGRAAVYLPEPPQDDERMPSWSRESARMVARALEQTGAERANMVAEGLQNAAGFSVAGMTRRYLAIYQELLYKS